MTVPTKSTSLQAYRLILYRRALHPELFPISGRRSIEHMAYNFEAWVMPGAHLLRFEHDGSCATELITPQEQGIPERGMVAAVPCAGERDHEEEFGDKVKFYSTIQTEQLPETLYAATYDELMEFANEQGAMVHTWNDEDNGRCASIVDIQRFRREVHVQTYHMLAQGGTVLRSQSLFEHKAPAKD